MSIFVAVVSHNHSNDIIYGLKPHKINALANVTVVIKDNRPCGKLHKYCEKHGIDYLPNVHRKGFGQNNNDIYLYCRIKYNMTDDDLFIALNPDVIVNPNTFQQLDKLMVKHEVNLAAPNLYKDAQMKTLEGSVRKFPMPWDFISSFVFKSQRTTVARERLNTPASVDWASGAFLAFRAKLYKKLSGFDPRYYLYCEDLDICWRAKILLDEPTWYFPDIKAIHKGHRHSRSLLSIYFCWHVTSVIKFSRRYLAWRWFGMQPKQKSVSLDLT